MPNLDNAETKMKIASLLGMPLADLGRDIDAACPKFIKLLMEEFENPQAAMIALSVFYLGMATRVVKNDINPVEWAHELIDTVGMLMITGTFDYEGMNRK